VNRHSSLASLEWSCSVRGSNPRARSKEISTTWNFPSNQPGQTFSHTTGVASHRRARTSLGPRIAADVVAMPKPKAGRAINWWYLRLGGLINHHPVELKAANSRAQFPQHLALPQFSRNGRKRVELIELRCRRRPIEAAALVWTRQSSAHLCRWRLRVYVCGTTLGRGQWGPINAVVSFCRASQPGPAPMRVASSLDCMAWAATPAEETAS